MRLRGRIGGLCLCAALALALGLASSAQANRALIGIDPVDGTETPAGQIEDACGVASDSDGGLFVSDYYHGVVDVFDSGGYQSQIAVGASPEGPCQLALASSGALYANDYHQDVIRLSPSPMVFDDASSTGVALDAAGDVYADDRTYAAAYQPSGAPLLFEGQPLQIGLDPGADYYGLAVSAFPATKGEVYLADAADNTVKAFDPAHPASPSAVISGPPGGFHSLTDAAVAIDPTNGHLLVADDPQPGFEHPEAAIDEFDASGAFLGQLQEKIIDAQPTGLAFDGSGDLDVTSGNSEGARVLLFGHYSAAGPAEALAPLFEGGSASRPPTAPALIGAAGRQGAADPAAGASEVTQRGHLRVTFDGALRPHALPRQGVAPVRVTVGAKIATTDAKTPPQLRKISIAINKNGRFDPTGLPICRLDQIQPSTTADALEACRSSLIGEGQFAAKVLLAGQAPFPSNGKVYAFNSRLDGKPAILAHVYGTQPAPASYTLPFVLSRAKGTFANVLSASLPAVTSNSGYITGLEMTLGRNFTYKGKRRSYLSAGCPAPKGFPGAVFSFARASFGFGSKTVSSTLSRSCRVEGR